MSEQAIFWDRMDGINAGMLGLTEDLGFVPMSHYTDRKAGQLWFIGARGTHLAEASQTPREALHIIACQHGKLFARISGVLEAVDDPAKLDELWNTVAEAWFEDGKRDDDVQLMRFTPARAEVWATEGRLGFLYQIAKARISGEKPDMGQHFEVSFG